MESSGGYSYIVASLLLVSGHLHTWVVAFVCGQPFLYRGTSFHL